MPGLIVLPPLSPCICGERMTADEVVTIHLRYIYRAVRCRACGSSGPERVGMPAAIEAWNVWVARTMAAA